MAFIPSYWRERAQRLRYEGNTDLTLVEVKAKAREWLVEWRAARSQRREAESEGDSRA